MLARKCLLTCVADDLFAFSSRAAKCAATAAKAADVHVRCCPWIPKRSSNLCGSTLSKLNVAAIMDPSRQDGSRDKMILEDMDVCNSSDEENHETESLYSQRRHFEYTTYGQSVKDFLSSRGDAEDVVTVGTFNVLSQALLSMHPYLYEKCRRKDLKWSIRRHRLLRDFQYLNPDVFCLQEVEANHLDFFKTELGRLGYTGIYKKRTNDKVDGAAIFYKTEKFNLEDSRVVEFYKKSVRLLDRDNVGLMVKLSLKRAPAKQLVVATTHLLYNTRRTDIRLTQTQMMLAEIDDFSYRESDSYWPIIYTGDMNYTPESPVYELVTNGYLQYDCRGLQLPSYTGSAKVLLPEIVGVTDSCQFTQSLVGRGEMHRQTLHGSGALDHRLNLHSVYPHVKGKSIEATTYQDQWHTVDYIFYSQNGRTKTNCDHELRLVSRLGLPTSEMAKCELGNIPSAVCGSDHLPLLATFHLTDSRVS